MGLWSKKVNYTPVLAYCAVNRALLHSSKTVLAVSSAEKNLDSDMHVGKTYVGKYKYKQQGIKTIPFQYLSSDQFAIADLMVVHYRSNNDSTRISQNASRTDGNRNDSIGLASISSLTSPTSLEEQQNSTICIQGNNNSVNKILF